MCSVVIVAGSSLWDFSSVRSTVDSLGQQMLKIPYLMVLLVDDPTMILNTSSHPMSPPMVGINLSKSYPLYLHKVRVTRGRNGQFVTDFFCIERLEAIRMVFSRKRVNKPIKEVCPQRQVRVAYNQYKQLFRLDVKNNNKMVIHDRVSKANFVAETSVILSDFFTYQNLSVTWQDGHGVWGNFDSKTQKWTGAVGIVSMHKLIQFIRLVSTYLISLS